MWYWYVAVVFAVIFFVVFKTKNRPLWLVMVLSIGVGVCWSVLVLGAIAVIISIACLRDKNKKLPAGQISIIQ